MDPNAKTTLQRALSRKFLVTLTALIALFQTTHLDLASKIIIACVASVYVIGETVLDKGGQARLLEVTRAALGGAPSSGPISATTALLGAVANASLSTEAKALLSQAKTLVDAAAASGPAASQVPDTVTSPPKS